VPEIRDCVLWTSFELSEEDILKIYRDRGTNEQYHAELKTEMNMEWLPSGKFVVNSAFLLLGMLVYNMLKVVGRDTGVCPCAGAGKGHEAQDENNHNECDDVWRHHSACQEACASFGLFRAVV
jgi:hypothetical protein